MKAPPSSVLVFLRPEMEDILSRYDELERWHKELGRRLEALHAKITRINDRELARMNAPETNYEAYEDEVNLDPPTPLHLR